MACSCFFSPRTRKVEVIERDSELFTLPRDEAAKVSQRFDLTGLVSFFLPPNNPGGMPVTKNKRYPITILPTFVSLPPDSRRTISSDSPPAADNGDIVPRDFVPRGPARYRLSEHQASHRARALRVGAIVHCRRPRNQEPRWATR